MLRVLRQYGLSLLVILARPWTWLMLGMGLLYVVPTTIAWTLGRTGFDPSMTPVAVVDAPPAAAPTAARGPAAETTEWDTRWTTNRPGVTPSTPFDPEGQGTDWPMLDRAPALERLWMHPPDMLSAEGWRRIGDHAGLEVLGVARVSSPDADTLARYPALARAALERLPRLRELDLRGTGGSFDLLLPPLPALEVLGIGWGRLEENLRTLADRSPRLRAIVIETWRDFTFTPAMIAALRRMPNLRTVSIAGAFSLEGEPEAQRQLTELRRALPGVSVRPGTYCNDRVWKALVLSILGGVLPFVFWFQTGVLLSTALAWMMPRRLAPHLFWPVAVAAVCAGGMVGVARSVGIAWVPALTLAMLVTMASAGGMIQGDVSAPAARISSAVVRVDLFGGLVMAAIALLFPWVADRWLSGGRPWLALAMFGVTVLSAAWKLLRHARLPRIVAGLGLASAPGLELETAPAARGATAAASAGWQWWLVDVGTDRQIARPVPAPFANMLRRPQSRYQVPFMLATMAVAVVGALALMPTIMARVSGQPSPAITLFAPPMIAAFAWQGAAFGLALTAAMWGQRRGSLVVDFLRPVSREEYWRGLRQAIARDLVLPVLLGAACLATGVWSTGTREPTAWIVAALVLVGTVAASHALILLLAITRWPLVVGTVSVLTLLAAMIGSVIAVSHALSVSKPADSRTAWLVAGAVLAIGLAIHVGVLWRLEEREIG